MSDYPGQYGQGGGQDPPQPPQYPPPQGQPYPQQGQPQYPQQPPQYPQQPRQEQPYPPPPSQPYPQSAPTQMNPQYNPPPWQAQQDAPGQGFPQAPPVPAAYDYGQYGGQPVPAGMYQDQQSGLMLPQGTQLATPGRRIGAFFLAIPLTIITLGIGYIIWGLIAWGKGQTPALQVLGMRVWRPDDNRPAGFWWMALREIIGRIADGILSIITELISLVFMLTRPDRRTLHDLVAGTVVLHDPNKVIPK
jgi:uncharacterized RDD family membrane protein YckC